MKLFLPLAAVTIAVLAAPATQASILTSSLPAFQAGLGRASANTTSNLGTPFATISTVALVNGNRVSLSGTADTIDQPGVGRIAFSNGYTGQVVDSTTNTETLRFATPLTSFGLTVAPDVPLLGPTLVNITVQLPGGASTTVAKTFNGGDVQFFGYTSGPETGLTITTSTSHFAFGQFLTGSATAVPEPGSVLVLITGLLAAAPLLRRRS